VTQVCQAATSLLAVHDAFDLVYRLAVPDEEQPGTHRAIMPAGTG